MCVCIVLYIGNTLGVKVDTSGYVDFTRGKLLAHFKNYGVTMTAQLLNKIIADQTKTNITALRAPRGPHKGEITHVRGVSDHDQKLTASQSAGTVVVTQTAVLQYTVSTVRR